MQILKAAMYVDFSKDYDPEADQCLLAVSGQLIGAMTIESLIALTGYGGAMFRVIVRQLSGGILELVSAGRIGSPNTLAASALP
ncbi:hypothetical protein [uncultured Roseobacter sp.]|nr:hypothetical protein [uncultured Roseobacter sp.]